jgi:hypothetical protein
VCRWLEELSTCTLQCSCLIWRGKTRLTRPAGRILISDACEAIPLRGKRLGNPLSSARPGGLKPSIFAMPYRRTSIRKSYSQNSVKA